MAHSISVSGYFPLAVRARISESPCHLVGVFAFIDPYLTDSTGLGWLQTKGWQSAGEYGRPIVQVSFAEAARAPVLNFHGLCPSPLFAFELNAEKIIAARSWPESSRIV